MADIQEDGDIESHSIFDYEVGEVLENLEQGSQLINPESGEEEEFTLLNSIKTDLETLRSQFMSERTTPEDASTESLDEKGLLSNKSVPENPEPVYDNREIYNFGPESICDIPQIGQFDSIVGFTSTGCLKTLTKEFVRMVKSELSDSPCDELYSTGTKRMQRFYLLKMLNSIEDSFSKTGKTHGKKSKLSETGSTENDVENDIKHKIESVIATLDDLANGDLADIVGIEDSKTSDPDEEINLSTLIGYYLLLDKGQSSENSSQSILSISDQHFSNYSNTSQNSGFSSLDSFKDAFESTPTQSNTDQSGVLTDGKLISCVKESTSEPSYRNMKLKKSATLLKSQVKSSPTLQQGGRKKVNFNLPKSPSNTSKDMTGTPSTSCNSTTRTQRQANNSPLNLEQNLEVLIPGNDLQTSSSNSFMTSRSRFSIGPVNEDSVSSLDSNADTSSSNLRRPSSTLNELCIFSIPMVVDKVMKLVETKDMLAAWIVCKDWHEGIGDSGVLWKRTKVYKTLDFQVPWEEFLASDILRFHCPNFHIIRCDLRLEKPIEFFSQNSYNLNYLALDNCEFSLATLQHIFMECTKLVHFEIIGFPQQILHLEAIFPAEDPPRYLKRVKTLILNFDPDNYASRGLERSNLNRLSRGFLTNFLISCKNVKTVKFIGWRSGTCQMFLELLYTTRRLKHVKEITFGKVPIATLDFNHFIALALIDDIVQLETLEILLVEPQQEFPHGRDYANVILREILRNHTDTLKTLSFNNCPITEEIFIFRMSALENLSLLGTHISNTEFVRIMPNLNRFVFTVEPRIGLRRGLGLFFSLNQRTQFSSWNNISDIFGIFLCGVFFLFLYNSNPAYAALTFFIIMVCVIIGISNE